MSVVVDQHRKRVGRNIRAARLAAHLTLDRLAEKVGTSRQHLIRIEGGIHLPRPAMLQAIAREVGASPSDLEADDDEESDPVADLVSVIRRLVREEIRSAA